MVTPRYSHTATLLRDGTVLVTSAVYAEAAASAELYHPSGGIWTATGSMDNPFRAGYTATLLLDGRVLVAGGHSSFPDGLQLASAELYDPGSGTWTVTGNLIEARGGHTATLLPNGTVLVTGGSRDPEGPLASAELYDPASGSWTAAGSMIEARVGHTATLLLDGKVLVAGGLSSFAGDGYLASVERYDPGSGTWTATGDLIEARGWHTATLLSDGRVLVAGGLSSSTDYAPLASAELYDPGSGTWTATGSMIDAREDSTATLLPDGRVLVVGSHLTAAELYDPSSGSWTATGNMVTRRRYPTATLLLDGKVLVAGGNSSSGQLAAAELYDPGSGP
jgi:N-acetylneuraminic acid mutarotase